ncbi:MAG: TGS domain-containing protein [bacterium]|nr:TGS domain-containing protein [bacterium]
MPANLPPTYHAAEDRYRAAVTPEEKLATLEEMLRLMPKHKGTDKLQAGLRSRIAKLKRQPKKKAGGHGFSHHIPKEGAGQVALVGPPSSGKSALVSRFTHASPQVAEYPLTTRDATPGMMEFEDTAFQLVDLPPLCDQHVEPWVYDCIRTADMIWLVLAAESSLEGLELVERLLAAKAIAMTPVGSTPPAEPRPGWTYKSALMVVTGLDRAGAREDLELLDELLEVSWLKVGVSSVSEEGSAALGRRTFEALGIIRVYSKQPGKPADREQPFTVAKGSTVGELARSIHQDLAEHFKFARVWGADVFDGQKVRNNHVLNEGDVVEIHM